MSEWVINVTDENFEREVIQRSNAIPVVADFWAAWCGPCRALGPVLEALAQEYDGKFLLAKVDTEQAPRAASEFRVQSIPAVYGIRAGQIVDGFLGALPEEQIREWLGRFLPSESDQLVEKARTLATSQPDEAEKMLRQASELDPRNAEASIELAKLLLHRDRLDDAEQIISDLESRGFLEPEAERVKSALEIRRGNEATGGLEVCREALANDPDNPDKKLAMAQALAAIGDYEQALQMALSIVEAERGEIRDRARKVMVDIFNLLPADSELTSEYRRKLSLALF